MEARMATVTLEREREQYVVSAHDGAALIGRLLLASIFIISGWGKITGFGGTAGYIASQGMPMPEVLTVIAIVFELGGGLAIALGWKARWAALALALFLVVITPIFHAFWAVAPDMKMAQLINFQKNVAILGAFILVYAFGPGRYSIDRG
jgi:putative oxidoreductase